VVDCHASNGILEPPTPQKIYWSITEGMTCIALLVSGAAAAKLDPTVSSNAGLASLQAASIIAGLPMCFNLCF
jgi:hypothetical protein